MTPPTNQDWLNKTPEETLEPDLPICDPHHHLWDQRPDQVGQRYLLDELLDDVNSGHNVVSTVFIECGSMYASTGPEHMRVLGETEFVNGIAAMSASGLYGRCRIAAGIVGTANLKRGSAVAEVLDAHLRIASARFRGIRHQAPWDDDPSVPVGRGKPGPHEYLDATFREGFAELAPRGLSFEAWCYHPQIVDLTDLARAFPDTTIIFNHFGGPLGIGRHAGQREAIYGAWKKDVAELARCANVVAKLGGINMILNGFDWHLADTPPGSETLAGATQRYYDHTLECFGPERCMFESNFPVDKVSCSYNVVWNTFKRLAAGFSDDEKAALFHDTATRVYRLD